MEVFVYSRNAIDAARPHEVPHIVISITSSVEDRARVREGGACKGVLRLSFPDAAEPTPLHTSEQLFSSKDAEGIWAFVRAHQPTVSRILVHCDAGKSRSPAVAAALAKVLNGDDAEYFGGRYEPNPLVYRLMLAASGAALER